LAAQLERQLEDELDAMPSVQEDMDNDETDNDNAYDEYNLIVVPGQPQAEQTEQAQLVNSSDEEEQNRGQQQVSRQQHRDAVLQRMQQSPAAGGGGDLTTIEIISSNEEEDEDSESDDDQPAAAMLNESSDDEEDNEVGVIDDSDSDEDNINYSASDDSDSEDGPENHLERTFENLLAQPNKQFAQLVKLGEIAFKLNDLAKIELAVQTLQKDATVPAHIWLKYLKARQVVTQTAEEYKEFEEKCATALGYHYNIPLADFIVGYLQDLNEDNQNRMLWLKLMADYEVERPDYIEKLTAKYPQLVDNTEAEAFRELMTQHCVTWNIPAEQRQTINRVVSEFKLHLDDTKLQYSDWDWAKLHTQHVEQVLSLDLNDGIKNALIRFIFERSVSKFPTADALWLAYIKFMQGEGNAEDQDEEDANAELAAKRASRLGKGFLRSTVLDLAKRGVRCRPSVRLNHKLLVLMERADFDQAQVDEQINNILQRIEPDMTMTVELHLDYLAYRVRNTNASDESQATNLRAAFFKIWEDLSEVYGDQADTSYEVLQLWAQVEYTHLGNPANGSNIWRQIMGYPGSNQRGMLWMSYAQMESEYNAGQSTRDILREALEQPCLVDGLVVHELFRRYERCYGTYESIAACQAIELPPDYARRTQPAPRQNRLLQAARQNRSQPQQQGQAKPRQQSQLQAPAQGRAPAQLQASAEPQAQSQPPLNRQQRRRQAHEMMTGNTRQQEPKEAAPSTAKEPAANSVTQPPAKPAAPEVRESYLKYSPHMETNKVFVRNLHPACTKEELQELFKPFGHVKDVRLVHRQKQMRGIAYIEYEKPEQAQKAVSARNGHELHGIAIFVAISNPPPKAGQTEQAAGDGGGSALKKRVLTSLIPTSVVRQESVAAKKRRIELAQAGD
ncbi:hypothetical protein KR032_011216, partial [Drosophila birchii]